MVMCKKCNTECVKRISKTDKNYDREFYACPSKCKQWNGWVEEEQIEEFHCQKCDKKLDVKYEIGHNLKRYGIYGGMPTMETEFMDAIKKGEYTCEKCLHNE